MSEFTIFSLITGEIKKTVSCSDCDIQYQYSDDNEGCISGSYPDNLYHIVNREPIAFTQRPSEFHTFNYTAKQWEDLRTLDDLKAAQWTAIKKARSAAEYAGFTWDGSTFDSDVLSQNRITGAVSLAQMSSAFTIGWILADNTVRTLNQISMLQVGATLGQHVAEVFAKGVLLREAVEAATTQAEVEAVVW